MYNGLSSQQVKEKLSAGKWNKKTNNSSRSIKEIVSSCIFTYFNFINVVLFCFVLLTGKLRNGLFIFTVIINSCIGIYQQIKSKKLLDRLSIMAENKVHVKRDGSWIEISPEEIVEEDCLKLQAGMQIPCDCIVEDGSLEVDESSLTGESNLLEKHQKDLVLAGTIVHAGSAIVKVDKVGEECEIHQIIAAAGKENRAESVLQKNLDKIIHIISVCIIPAGILLFCSQYFLSKMAWDEALLKMVAAVVGMIPEGLVVLTSAALAISIIRLSKRMVLVQDLFSIESLARVDTVCFDKTGTLTTGNMLVTDLVCKKDCKRKYVEEIMGSYLKDTENPNSTDKALLKYFQVNQNYKILDSLAFSSTRKYAAKYLEDCGAIYVGAPVFLFPNNHEVRDDIQSYIHQGKRVIAIGYSKKTIEKDILPDNLRVLAYVVIQDEMRTNAKQIVEYFKKQNVMIKVISGDDAATVSALAAIAGIAHAENAIDVSSTTLSIDEIASQYTVFGRVRPQEKMELIEALQRQGKHVLMSGDGVNDVAAMKVADVSVTVGEGSDAAKNTANIVLLNNDFSAIPHVVDEGRRVINNITRASTMYLVKTVFSILISIYVVLKLETYPFLPIHLTLLSAIGVGIPTFLFQLEPSFERISGDFIKQSFKKALPSSIAIFVTAILCLFLKQYHMIDMARFFGILVLLTGYVYLITLYRVYSPLTKLRVFILCSMACILFIALFKFSDMLYVSYHFRDLWILLCGLLLEPALIYCVGRLEDVYEKYNFGN